MNIVATVDFSEFDASLRKLAGEIKDRLVFRAAEAGGEVYVKAYRLAVPRSKKIGTFRSAREQVKEFQRLYMSIGKKTKLFDDRTGAYCVIGVEGDATSHKPVAPQGMWIEWGTDERHHADGSPTGKVEPQNIMKMVIEQNRQKAQDAATAVLVRGLANVT